MKKNKLKYSFLNEDPNCELKVMASDTETLVCIAGGGFRVLPLLAKPNLKTVYVVDQSHEQLDHAQKVIGLLNEPDYESFIQYLRPQSANSPLYVGQHEQSYFFRSYLMSAFFWGQFKPNIDLTQTSRWFIFVKLYARLLRKIRRDTSALQNYTDYLTKSFRKLMATPYPKNFFWQQLLYGHAQTAEAFSELISEKNWVTAKNKIAEVKIHYVHSDVIEFLSSKTDEIDFISFSNVINYLSDAEKYRLEEALEKSLRRKGQILMRSYLDPIKLNSKLLTEDAGKNNILESEMTGSYVMKVYEKI